MKFRLTLLGLVLAACPLMHAATFYVAPDGQDNNTGAVDSPFATIMAAQAAASAGDTVYLRGGTYHPDNSNITSKDTVRAYVNTINKAGIHYIAYPGERPIFDFSNVKPAGFRVTAFYVTASDCEFKGFDIIGVQVVVTAAEASNTQSECFYIYGGNRNRFEDLAMHDGMGIGWYLVKGKDNLVINCDAYNNNGLDVASTGNVDGFGCHPNSTGSTGNRITGCRAWFNSDDGFDLINAYTAVTIDHCWAFYNGYETDFTPARDGNGFKAGGYGSNGTMKFPIPVPRHTVKFCLAVGNKANGFYANHHTGGIDFVSNTAIHNGINYNMLSTLVTDNDTDVPGTEDYLKNNVGYNARGTEVENLDQNSSDVSYNYFTLPVTVDASDFVSLDESLLTQPRKANGDLPDIDYARLAPGSDLIDAGVDVGYPYNGAAPDLGAFESGGEATSNGLWSASDVGLDFDSGDPLGWIWAADANWAWSYTLQHWVYCTTPAGDTAGAWAYVLK